MYRESYQFFAEVQINDNLPMNIFLFGGSLLGLLLRVKKNISCDMAAQLARKFKKVQAKKTREIK